MGTKRRSRGGGGKGGRGASARGGRDSDQQRRDVRKTKGSRRRELFERVLREEDYCWICRQLVDKSLRGVRVYNPRTKARPLHPQSPSLDECVPVSFGGDPLARSNVRLAHLVCNERRGDALAADPHAQWYAPLVPARSADAGARAAGAAVARSRDWTS